MTLKDEVLQPLENEEVVDVLQEAPEEIKVDMKEELVKILKPWLKKGDRLKGFPHIHAATIADEILAMQKKLAGEKGRSSLMDLEKPGSGRAAAKIKAVAYSKYLEAGGELPLKDWLELDKIQSTGDEPV